MKKLITFFMIVFLVIGIIPGTLTLNAAQQKIGMSGRAHIQNFGNRDGRIVNEKGIETLVLGTRGMSKRLESVAIKFTNNTGYFGSIEYQVHVQKIGWMPWVSNGQSAGTQGQSKRLEGIRIRLTGDLANYYDVRYSTHIQLYGDTQGWVYNGGLAGTTGESKRLEELKIQIIPKKTINEEPYVTYRTHVQTYGWERTWKKYGEVAGTTGQAKRLEGIEVRLNDNTYGGGIEYKTHIQSYGWQGYCRNGEMSGTQGQSKRLEAIEVRLTGNIANYYDVFYRVHAQNYGWLNWAKNGDPAGTEGLALRLEAIQVVLLPKGKTPPPTYKGVTSTRPEAFISASGQTPTPQPTGHTCEYPKFNSVPKEFKGYFICVNEKHYEWVNDVIIPTNSKGESANECGYCHQVFYGDFTKHIKESHPDNWLNYFPYYEPVGYKLMN